MKILEVRDGFIKFESFKGFEISSFIEIKDTRCSYIAQVFKNQKIGEDSIISAEIQYCYNGVLYDYDNTLPSYDSDIIEFNSEDINKIFKTKSSIIVGNFIENNQPIYVDDTCLDGQLLLSIDTSENNKTIISNLAKQFEKSIIIDTLGIFNKNKFSAGVDFKLPLTTEALEFMYEECLNDATSDSKALIKEIFTDLADYSKTVPFVPFGALKSIVDEMVEKSHIFKLIVLKNKLSKFDKLGYFAATVEEASNLKNILNKKDAIIDLSKLDSTFQNRYLSIILSTIEDLNIKSQIFIEVSNSINKKSLKKIITSNLPTVFATHSRFKYLNEIKSMFKNYIIEPSFSNNEIFKEYSKLLLNMPKNTYLISGEATASTKLISNIQELNVFDQLDSETIEATDKKLLDTSEQDVIVQSSTPIESIEDEISEVDLQNNIESVDKKSEDVIKQISESIKSEVIAENNGLFSEEASTDEEDVEVEESSLEEDLTIEIEPEVIDKTTTKDNELSENDFVIENSETQLENSDENLISAELNTEIQPEELDNIDIPNEGILDSSDSYHTQVDDFKAIEISDEISDFSEDIIENSDMEVVSDNEIEPIILEDQDVLADDIELANINNSLDEISDISENSTAELENPIEDVDIIVEMDEFEQEEDLDSAIVNDVDKVFTTMKQDTISDSDLDFIDELNNTTIEEDNDNTEILDVNQQGLIELEGLSDLDDNEEVDFIEPLEEINDAILKEEQILETKNTNTPIIPVYDADIPEEDTVVSDSFEQGDVVIHAKYGNGVVEKMIKYGAKTLYSINFDTVGRRLLDPTLTEIKKS